MAEDSDRVQMNVRLPRELRDRIDARRTTLNPPISRDKWVERALTYLLDAPARPRRPKATVRRTLERRR